MTDFIGGHHGEGENRNFKFLLIDAEIRYEN